MKNYKEGITIWKTYFSDVPGNSVKKFDFMGSTHTSGIPHNNKVNGPEAYNSDDIYY
jgi:hypothetical protein